MRSREFYKAKHFVDTLLLFEMKLNRISSITIHNRAPAIPATPEEPVVDVNDDSDGDVAVVEEKPVVVDMVREYLFDPVTLEEIKTHYTDLYFTWTQEGDKIVIAWH